MKASDVSRAVGAAASVAASCSLSVDSATIVNRSNRLVLLLSPCGAFARVARVGREIAQLEVDIARELAESEDCPVAGLDPRVTPAVYEQDGFTVTLWSYHGSQATGEISPAEYANALTRLHAGMRMAGATAPHFTDRVAEAEQLVTSRDLTPALGEVDRGLLAHTLRSLRRSIGDRDGAEQLLHGEPHPGNVISAKNGPLFIDFETCCRGPVEFDLAHVPHEVSDLYPDVDEALLSDCRGLALAMVAAWRWDRDDEFPNGREEGHKLLSALRDGPPWPALGE